MNQSDIHAKIAALQAQSLLCHALDQLEATP